MRAQYHQEILTGRLEIDVLKARLPMNDILTFGARQNPKRGYLFISKILGKYIPCRPTKMRESYQLLAKDILTHMSTSKNVWVLGVAETAVGLGGLGVARRYY